MAHTISRVNGSYHENPVNNVANHHNENQSTTNHIYLHPGHHSGEFENWMRKIGGLLQVGSEAMHLKPLLDLLVAVVEPERMFFFTFPAIETLKLKPYHELRLVFKEERLENVSSLEGFVKLASFKDQNIMITLQSDIEFDENSIDDTQENALYFREEFLVFSNSPYRLRTHTDENIEYICDNALRLFTRHYEEGVEAFQIGKDLLNKKHGYQAYSLLVRATEQIYNAIIYPFEFSTQVGIELSEVKKKAAKHLPQLFHFDFELIEIEELSTQLLYRKNIPVDLLSGSYPNVFEIVEEFIPYVRPCFESKLNYLKNYGKGKISHE